MHFMMWSMAVGRKIAISLLLISCDTDCLLDLGLLICIVSERFHQGPLRDLANVQIWVCLFVVAPALAERLTTGALNAKSFWAAALPQ